MPGKRWTLKDIEAMKALEGSPQKEAALALGVSIPALRAQARKHGVKFKSTRPGNWTKQDEDMLRELSKRYSLQQAADRLGRSLNSVKLRSAKLSISFKDGRTTMSSLADELGVHVATLRRRADKLHLPFRAYKSPTNGKKTSNTSGPTSWQVAKLAKDLLDNPPQARCNVSAKRMREVIDRYSYGYDGARVTKLSEEKLTGWLMSVDPVNATGGQYARIAARVIDKLIYGHPVEDLLAQACHYELNYESTKTGARVPTGANVDYTHVFKTLDVPQRATAYDGK